MKYSQIHITVQFYRVHFCILKLCRAPLCLCASVTYNMASYEILKQLQSSVTWCISENEKLTNRKKTQPKFTEKKEKRKKKI